MELSSLVRKLGNGSPLPPGAAGSAAEGRRGLPDPSAGLRVCVGGRRGACSTPAYSAVGVSPVKRARRLRVGARPLAWEGAGGAASFLGSRGERRSLPDLRVHTAAPPPPPEPLASFPPCVFPLFSPLPTWEGAVTHGGASLGNAEGFPLQKGCLSIR